MSDIFTRRDALYPIVLHIHGDAVDRFRSEGVALATKWQRFRLEEYEATRFVLGDCDFQVAGQSSLGNGPESEVATISIADDSLAQPTGFSIQRSKLKPGGLYISHR